MKRPADESLIDFDKGNNFHSYFLWDSPPTPIRYTMSFEVIQILIGQAKMIRPIRGYFQVNNFQILE